MVGGEDELDRGAVFLSDFDDFLGFNRIHNRSFLGAIIDNPAVQFTESKLFNLRYHRQLKTQDLYVERRWELQVRIVVFQARYVIDLHRQVLGATK